jgi:very-short-patch-repair endonuclease
MSSGHAKSLRQNMTDAERRLWYRLRANRFADLKFKRQIPIGPYIVDFVSFSNRLVIEVDGGQHAERRSDVLRDRWFEDQGFKVLRFWNDDVLRSTNLVLDQILNAIEAAPSPGSVLRTDPPSPTRGEGK